MWLSIYGLSRQVVFNCRENKHDLVDWAREMMKFCVLGKTFPGELACSYFCVILSELIMKMIYVNQSQNREL